MGIRGSLPTRLQALWSESLRLSSLPALLGSLGNLRLQGHSTRAALLLQDIQLRLGMQGLNSTGSSVHNPLDGPHDFETSPSEAQDSSRPSDPEPAAPPSARPPLSWYGATKYLRDKLQELQRRAQQGPLQHGAAEELAQLKVGQAAFDKLLPKLKAAQYLDLRDLPRTPRGPPESGRFNFFLPSLKGVSPADLALASTWLSHRDVKDWAALNLAGLSTAKIIDRWLVPHQATSSVDHVAEIRRVIRRLVQATDKSAAIQAWSTQAVRFSRLSQSGIMGTRDPKGDGGRRLATSPNDVGNLVGAPPDTAADEQTTQNAQSGGGIQQWSCLGTWVYLDDSQSQTILHGFTLEEG